MDREKAFGSPLVGVAPSARDGQHTCPCFQRGICFVEGVRFLCLILRGSVLLSTLVASISVGAPLDVKQSDDAGKEKPATQEEKGEKGEYQPPPPVVTEHTVTLPGGKMLNYKAITGYLLIRDTKEGTQSGEGFRQGISQRECARPT